MNIKITRKRLIACSAIVIIIIALTLIIKHETKQNINVATNSNYILLSNTDTYKVKQGTVNDSIAFTGDLYPLKQATISSEVSAIVKKVLVQEGQFVIKDQVLAILDNVDLRQALSEQEAQLSVAKVKFVLDKTKLQRQKLLLAQGFISKIAFDELRANYQASLENINQQQASVIRAKQQLSNTIIKAPFSGYIYQKNVDAGQLVNISSKLFALANLDILQIKAAIPSNYINQIKVNQDVLFKLGTKLGTDGQQYQGKVTFINPIAEVGTRSYYVYINFNNRNLKLNAGQFVKGQVILSSLKNVLYISSDAIINTDGNTSVLVLDNNKVVKRTVKVLISDNLANISAITGLQLNDIVLANSVLIVQPGDMVKIIQ